jgi:hypothetical protein
VNPRRSYSRHGLHVPKVAVKARGFGSVDGRTAAARAFLSFRAESHYGSRWREAELSPQQRKLVDLAARASPLVNHRDRTLLPALVQLQASPSTWRSSSTGSVSTAEFRRFLTFATISGTSTARRSESKQRPRGRARRLSRFAVAFVHLDAALRLAKLAVKSITTGT